MVPFPPVHPLAHQQSTIIMTSFFFSFFFQQGLFFIIIQTNKHTSIRKVYAVLNVLAPPNNTDNTCPQLLSFDPVVSLGVGLQPHLQTQRP